MRAAIRGRYDFARIVIEGRANVNANDSDGVLGLKVAEMYGHEDVVKLLQQKCAKLSKLLGQ